jgi:hypothetical protein
MLKYLDGAMTKELNGMRIFRIIILLFVTALILVCIESTRRSYDHDMWFHLEYGKHFIDNLTLSINHSEYSWTSALTEWKYVTWIGSSFMYLVYKHISIQAVMFLPFITLVLTLIVYYIYLKSIGSSYSLLTMSLFFIAAIFFYLPLPKPALATIVLFAVCLSIYYKSRCTACRLFWAYPILFLLWVNTHGGFLFGLFFLSFAFTLELLISWRQKTLQSQKLYFYRFGWSLFFSYIILLINPYGYAYLADLAKQFMMADALNPSSYILEYKPLWSSLDPLQNISPGIVGTGWAGILMLSFYMLLTLVELKNGRRADFISAFLLLVFFIMGMFIYRIFVFYYLVWLFSITWLIVTRPLNRSAGKLTIAAAIIMVYFIANNMNLYLLDGNRIQPFKHTLENIYPFNAAAFLKQNSLPANLINDYGTGGYLIWALYPEYKVFMDPRGSYEKQILLDCLALEKSQTETHVRAILDKYPSVRTAIFMSRFRNLQQLFLRLHDWRLVYFDHIVTIFVRTDSPKSRIRPDLDPRRFSSLYNPSQLANLFFMYQSLGSRDSASMIHNYYQKNVSSYYMYKQPYLHTMDMSLATKSYWIKTGRTRIIN